MVLHKCCPPHQILNEWQVCEDLPQALRSIDLFRDSLVDNICREQAEVNSASICSDQRVRQQALHFSYQPGLTQCPKRARVEMNLIDILIHNQTLVMQQAMSKDEMKVIRVNVALAGCVDLALLPNGDIEGPFVQSCHSLTDNLEGVVRKCCAKGQVLALDGHSCVDFNRSNDNWMPDRLLRHPGTGSVLFRHHLDIDATDLKECQTRVLDQKPLFLLSDGSAVYISGTIEESVTCRESIFQTNCFSPWVCQSLPPLWH